MLNRFLKIIETFQLPVNTRIIIAISGGIDSVALTHLFAMLNDTLGFRLELAHLTHNMRSKQESQKDRHLVQKIASIYQLPLHLHHIEEASLYSYGKEQVARTLRKQWLKSLCTHPEDRIALAHHLDDQIETVVMRLQRHYPLKGLAGIHMYNEPFIRPLLSFKKNELRHFLQERNFMWQEDNTNTDLTIERNHVRQKIINIKQSWPKFDADFLHLSQQANQYSSLLNHLLAKELGHSLYREGSFYFPYPRFLLLHYTIRNELIFYWFNQLMRAVVRPDFRLPTRFVEAINLTPKGSILLKGHGMLISRKKNQVVITRSASK